MISESTAASVFEPLIVCFAVKQEARFLVRPAAGGAKVQVLITGMGRQNAAAVVARALELHRPRLILTCGFAGGLQSGLLTGSVLFSADEASRLGPLLVKLGAVPGQFHCANRIAITSAEKRALRNSTGADAVEMESAAIRQLCQKQNIPSATIRVILDTVEETLPLDFNLLMSDRFEIGYRKLAWTVLKAPSRIPALIRFQRQTRQAAKRLGTILSRLLLKPPRNRCIL